MSWKVPLLPRLCMEKVGTAKLPFVSCRLTESAKVPLGVADKRRAGELLVIMSVSLTGGGAARPTDWSST